MQVYNIKIDGKVIENMNIEKAPRPKVKVFN